MYQHMNPVFFIAESPLHPGMGSDIGVVDKPIQRERHTSFPKVEASGIKGSLREYFESRVGIERSKVHLTFGYDGQNEIEEIKNMFANKSQFQGALGFNDVRLLFFPVKSAKGVFAWITCPKVLEQLRRDSITSHELVEDDLKVEIKEQLMRRVPDVQSGQCLIPLESVLKAGNNKIILEESSFESEYNEYCTTLASLFAKLLYPGNDEDENDLYSYWRNQFRVSFVILSDVDFRYFVTFSTEVVVRIKIDNKTGTALDGHLFTEEYLPTDSILYTPVCAGPLFHGYETKKIFTEGQETLQNESQAQFETRLVECFFNEHLTTGSLIRCGGNQSLGKGILRVVR